MKDVSVTMKIVLTPRAQKFQDDIKRAEKEDARIQKEAKNFARDIAAGRTANWIRVEPVKKRPVPTRRERRQTRRGQK